MAPNCYQFIARPVIQNVDHGMTQVYKLVAVSFDRTKGNGLKANIELIRKHIENSWTRHDLHIIPT